MSDVDDVISEHEIEEVIEDNVVVEEETQEHADNQQNETEANQQQDVKIKRVRNPQPKLNSVRLKGPRGIQTLEDVFKKIKFKGRGHEEEDLKTLLKGYEYWCHRLFPKFRFDDCIERIERLGTKKDVQTHIKKIRMNMLFLDEINDVVPEDKSEEEEESQVDSFSALLSTNTQQSMSANTHTQANELSEEQMELIRANKERALKRRQELMQQKNTILQSQEHAGSSSMFEEITASVELPANENVSKNADELGDLGHTSPVRILEKEYEINASDELEDSTAIEGLSLSQKNVSETKDDDENMDVY